MATRSIFYVEKNESSVNLYTEKQYTLKWEPGFSSSQKTKNINNLHNIAVNDEQNIRILEVSSKSPDELGQKLSAFYLMIHSKNKDIHFSVECAYQSSKVFEFGGPYLDLLTKKSIDSKRDARLTSSGELKSFSYFGQTWNLYPRTAFYDWLYINALYRQPELYNEVIRYDAFSDIEFNPEKSLSCQARSVAICVSLYRRGMIEKALSSKDSFIEIIYGNDLNDERTNQDNLNRQMSIFDKNNV